MTTALGAEIPQFWTIFEFNILEEMSHLQPPTPDQTDNSTADSIVNLCVQPKGTKAMDMRFHWLRGQGVNKKNSYFIGAWEH